METETVGRRIRQARKKKGFSQVEFAEKLGQVPRSVISEWENESKKSYMKYVDEICEVLEIDKMWLLTGIDSTNQAVADLGLTNESLAFLKALAAAEGDKPFPIRWVDGYAPGEELYGTSPAKNFIGDYNVESIYPAEVLQLLNWLLSRTEGRELLSMMYAYLFIDEINSWLSVRSPDYQTEKALFPIYAFDVILQDKNHQTLIEPELLFYAMKSIVDAKLDGIRKRIMKERKEETED